MPPFCPSESPFGPQQRLPTRGMLVGCAWAATPEEYDAAYSCSASVIQMLILGLIAPIRPYNTLNTANCSVFGRRA